MKKDYIYTQSDKDNSILGVKCRVKCHITRKYVHVYTAYVKCIYFIEKRYTTYVRNVFQCSYHIVFSVSLL